MAQSDVKVLLNGGFFNGVWTGEGEAPAVSYDRVYNAEDMVQPYRNVVTDGIFAYEKAGSGSDGEAELEMCFDCSVKSGENAVVLQTGTGLINHRWFELDHVETIELAQNSSLTTRVDSLIIQCNMGMTDRAMYLIYRQGTASQPALEGDGSTVFEFRLWNINVPSNQVGGSITLDDRRLSDECGVITGLLQQLTLQDRLNKFDEDVQNKLDEMDTALDNKLESMDETFNGKISGYDTTFEQKTEQYDNQYATKMSQYDSQFQQKLQTYDNSMTSIWAEWESLKAQIGSGGGGGGTTIVQGIDLDISRGYIEYTSGTITIDDYNAETDTIFIFINGLYANTTNDYDIDSTGVITFKNTINSGADIDWWKFRITQAEGGGGDSDTPPTQGFSLAIRQYDGNPLTAGDDGTYALEDGVSYFVTAPAFAGTYKWETKDGSSWNEIDGQTGVSVTVVGGEHEGIRCTVTYESVDYVSTEMQFSIEISGTAEAPVIQITETDGYVHQTAVSQNKVATPVIEVE